MPQAVANFGVRCTGCRQTVHPVYLRSGILGGSSKKGGKSVVLCATCYRQLPISQRYFPEEWARVWNRHNQQELARLTQDVPVRCQLARLPSDQAASALADARLAVLEELGYLP